MSAEMRKPIYGTLAMAAAVILVALTLMPLGAQKAYAIDKSASQGVSWVQKQVGKSIDYDGAYGAQCVDLVKAYYAYLGVSPVRGNGVDYTGNSLPAGWERVKGGKPQPGDILVYSGNGSNPYGHVGIYESDRVTYHQNFGNNQSVQRVTYRYDGLANPYWGYIRPNWNGGSQAGKAKSASAAPSVRNLQAKNVTKGNALLSATAYKDPGTYVSTCGIYLGTSKKGMTKQNAERVPDVSNRYHNGKDFDIWYDLNDELGIKLKAKTKYYYKFYVEVNGKEYTSDVASFTTK